MTENIVALPRAVGQPRAEVIEILEEVLALAKAGKIIAVGVAMVEPDYNIATSVHTMSPNAPLIAATTILAHRVNHMHTFGEPSRPWFNEEDT